MRKNNIKMSLLVVRPRKTFDHMGIHHFDSDQDYYAEYHEWRSPVKKGNGSNMMSGLLVYPNALDEKDPDGIFFPMQVFNQHFQDAMLISDRVYL